MKILLVNPPFFRFIGLEQDYVPLSLLAVGSELSRQGHEVLLKNCEIGANLEYKGYEDRMRLLDDYLGFINSENSVWSELRETIESFGPDKIGITIVNIKKASARKVIDIAREYCVDVFVGGPHPTIKPDSYNMETCVGEFESDGGRISDLDELAFPDFSILADNYSPNGYAHIVSGRGCPFRCRFCASCSIWGRNTTFKSVERLLEEMRYIHNYAGNDKFTFWDETFTMNKRRVREFCEGYNIDADWSCDTRADRLTKDLGIMMKDSRCRQLNIGVESGVQRILDYIGKDEILDNFRKAADIINVLDFAWKAYCIIGFPEETEEDMFATLEFVKSLHPSRITLSFFTPYEGTSFFDECQEKGLIPADFDEGKVFHQGSSNYFSRTMTRDRYMEVRRIISSEVDVINKVNMKNSMRDG